MKKYFWIIIILFFLPSISILTNCVFAGEKDIVVIESYNKKNKWDLDYTNEIIKKLGSRYKIHLFEMNTKVLPKSQHEAEALKGWQLILKIKPVLVILGDDAALKYLGSKVEEKKIRTVYLGINNNPRVYFKSSPKYVTGILERPLIRRSALFIKDIIPKAKKVLILFDKDRTSEIVYEDFFLSKPSVVFSDVKFDIFLVDKFAKWKNIILNDAKKYDAIVVGLYHTLVDENSKNVDSNDVIKWTSDNASVPLFAFWDFAVGKDKAMGGLVLPGAGQGKAAAEISEKILNDKNILPGSILPIYLQEGIFIFSKSGLKKDKIKLPESIQNNSVFVE